MKMSASEHEAVNDLVEEIMDELHCEPAAVMIKVAFAVLAKAITYATKNDPNELRRAASDLQQLMNMVQ
jgi:hypothetical protein